MLGRENDELLHAEEPVSFRFWKVVVPCCQNGVKVGQAATGREKTIAGLIPADDASHLLQSAMLDQGEYRRHLKYI